MQKLVAVLIVSVSAAWLLPSPSSVAEPSGQWREKTELVPDQASSGLVRRNFRVWDAHPELGLEFSWRPADESGKAAGAVTGSGELIWYPEGASAYDRRLRYSRFVGSLKDGRQHGRGTLSTRAGLAYDGEWKDGLMEGQGKIAYPTGEDYAGPFKAGKPAASAAGAPAIKLAQGGNPVSLNLYVDRVKNTEFKESGGELESYVYDQKPGPDGIEIGLDAPKIMQRWKGGGTVTGDQDSFLLDPGQFPPVFLVVDLINDGDRDAQIVGGYLHVADSASDLQPYFEISGIEYYGDGEKFDPNFTLFNAGWGQVENAKLAYGFRGASESFAEDLGSFDQSKEISVQPGLEGAGVNLGQVKNGYFTCPSHDEIPRCLGELVQSGLFGRLGPAMFTEFNHVYTQVEGAVDYAWTDSRGGQQQGRAPISVKVPMLDFYIGPTAEYGAPGAVSRSLPALQLGLDRENYRIPFAYREALAAQQNKRFAMTLDAAKSSRHRFRVVLEFADGTVTTSAPIDLLIFKPRAPAIY
ncbi:MAG: hypothetical protein ABWY38_05405 [Methyloceanibacter sp.]